MSWFHDVSSLGLDRPVNPMHPPLQAVKEPRIKAMIQEVDGDTWQDLFCASGLYGAWALLQGKAKHVRFVDRNTGEVEDVIASLGLRSCSEVIRGDVRENVATCDVTICCGGLYHIPDPGALLREIHGKTRWVIVQAVYNAMKESGVSRAGTESRAALSWYQETADEIGYDVVHSEDVERPGDAGSRNYFGLWKVRHDR